MALNVSLNNTVSKDAGRAIKNAQMERIRDGMDKGFAVSQELVPQDRGTLLQSGFVVTGRDDVVRFGYRAAHAEVMEKGADPFYPPIEPLLEWSQRVSGGLGLGFYVARHKIPEEGIDAQPYLEPGAEATKKWLKANSFGQYLEDEL